MDPLAGLGSILPEDRVVSEGDDLRYIPSYFAI
jgi:hypothetical protein